MENPSEHRYSRAIRELLLYCPKEKVNDVWNESRVGFWIWKERELLHRCYSEPGFIQKLEELVEELKTGTRKPRVDQSPDLKYHRKKDKAVSG